MTLAAECLAVRVGHPLHHDKLAVLWGRKRLASTDGEESCGESAPPAITLRSQPRPRRALLVGPNHEGVRPDPEAGRWSQPVADQPAHQPGQTSPTLGSRVEPGRGRRREGVAGP